MGNPPLAVEIKGKMEAGGILPAFFIRRIYVHD
nr:MAG TPA: hypothetical protein [Caudoviricetes sp.]